MVNTLLIIMRKVCNMEDYITVQHIELMNIVIMITGSIVGVAYITELFVAWYSGVEFEQYAFLNRATGPYEPHKLRREYVTRHHHPVCPCVRSCCSV